MRSNSECIIFRLSLLITISVATSLFSYPNLQCYYTFKLFSLSLMSTPLKLLSYWILLTIIWFWSACQYKLFIANVLNLSLILNEKNRFLRKTKDRKTIDEINSSFIYLHKPNQLLADSSPNPNQSKLERNPPLGVKQQLSL